MSSRINPPSSHIWFYSTNQNFRQFSNFYKHTPFTIDGKRYQTVEHYFQSQKFKGTLYEDKIINASTAMLAKRLGKSRKYPIINDWDNIRNDVMYKAVKTKFETYPHMKNLLLQTDKLILCEHTKNDKYWGDGGDPCWYEHKENLGENKLGQILMKVRDELRT